MKFMYSFFVNGNIEIYRDKKSIEFIEYKMIVTIAGVKLIYTRTNGLSSNVIQYEDKTTLETEDEINNAITRALKEMFTSINLNMITHITSGESIEILEYNNKSELDDKIHKYKCIKTISIEYKYDSLPTEYVEMTINTYGDDKHEVIDVADTIM